MKKLLLLCVLFCTVGPLLAQKVYFIYIQSDARTPFYIRMGDKVMSSTTSGYLILPKLKDSTYTFRLGPSANESELRFEVPVSGKDRGFLLKKFSDGWNLFDLQTLQRISPAEGSGGAATGMKLQQDRFTTLLAKAANDTSLLYQPVIAVAPAPEKRKKKAAGNEPERKETANGTATVAPDTGNTQTALLQEANTPADDVHTTALQTAGASPVAEPAETVEVPLSSDAGNEVYTRSLVTRKSESSTVEGFGIVYLDDVAGVVDTIRLMIPNPKITFAEAGPAAEDKEPDEKKVVARAVSCNGQATDKEYFKLRKNLASVDTETDMTQEALAAFRKKCFSTEQIKNLSSLFLTQAGKYAFFEAAYPFVSDKGQYGILQSEIFDPALLARFKALTSN